MAGAVPGTTAVVAADAAPVEVVLLTVVVAATVNVYDVPFTNRGNDGDSIVNNRAVLAAV